MGISAITSTKEAMRQPTFVFLLAKLKKVMDYEVKIKQPTMLCNFVSLLPVCGGNDLLAEVCTVQVGFFFCFSC